MMKESIKKNKKWYFIIGIPVILIILVCIGKRILFPPYEATPPSGSLSVASTSFTWTNESMPDPFQNDGSNRWLNVDFYYPEGAESQPSAYPLVIFSHGAFGIGLSNYSTYMELASHGYVVASISHTYHAAYCKSADGKTAIVSKDFIQQVSRNQGSELDAQEYLDSQEWMKIRRADTNFVLDTILEKAKLQEDFFASIDSNHIGLMGHSLGGATAVLLGRERSDIDAVIDLDGTMLGEAIAFADGNAIYREDPYPIPILDVYGEEHWNSALALGEQRGDDYSYINFAVDKRALCGHHTTISGTAHMNFTDLPLFSPFLASQLGKGEVDEKECISLVNQLTLSFFDCYLKEKGTFSVEEVIHLNND